MGPILKVKLGKLPTRDIAVAEKGVAPHFESLVGCSNNGLSEEKCI